MIPSLLEKCPKFPLLPGTKKPSVPWTRPYDGPIDLAAGYGIPTGARSGYWVLDLDTKGEHNGLQSISAYAEKCCEGDDSWCETFTVRTRSGGLHLYFTHVDHLTNRTGVLPGVDVRGAGGYVVGPGSPGYIVALAVSVVAAPEWLLDLVRSTARYTDAKSAAGPAPSPVNTLANTDPELGYRTRRAVQYLAEAPPCVEGFGGDAQLWTVALHLTRTLELPIPLALDLILPYNEKCRPPWKVADIARKLEEAQQRGTTPCGIPPEHMGKEPDMIPLPPTPEGIVPRVALPKPVYSFDLATDLGGSSETSPITSRDLFNIFLGPAWHGVWQKDEFRNKVVAVNPPLRLDAEIAGFTSTDVSNIGLWLNAHRYHAKSAVIDATVKSAASACRVHPVRQYLDGLPVAPLKDAVAYFTGIAGRLWGAPEGADPYESDCLRRFAIAAVRRVKVPGTKVDTMLVFSGAQGSFKSRFGEKLFGPWFTDHMPPLTNKDSAIQLQGHWCIEMAEMQAMRGVSEEARKEFLSRRIDKYRPPYERDVVEFPRQCVFYGTTNHDDILTDETGDRRYDICQVHHAIDLDFDRDAFWSAAVALESAGESHWRAADPESAARHKQQYQSEDAWAEKVLAWLRGKSAASGGPGYVFAADALTQACMIETAHQDDKALHRVKKILQRACGSAKVRWLDGKARRAYDVPPEVPAPATSTDLP